MPSFDVVSELDMHEVTNAVDQANREIGTRFDFRGTDAKVEQQDKDILMTAEAEFQLKQMLDILQAKLIKRGVDIGCIDEQPVEQVGKQARQRLGMREGIDKELAKKITKLVKESKTKVQAAIQGEKVRVTGKKRDDLQNIMAMLKAEKLDMPLQFDNFRD